MTNNSNPERIRYLWTRWMSKTSTPDEVEELFRLVKKHPLTELQSMLPANPEDLQLDDTMNEETKSAILHTILKDVGKPASARTFQFRWLRYAAAIVLVIGAATAGYFYLNPAEESPVSENRTRTVAPLDVGPGTQRAVLTLSNGSTILLDSSSNGTLAKEGTSDVIKKGDEIIYLANNETRKGTATVPGASQAGFNTMKTPRGGQYQLHLPDGTKVWLNAASSITYPTVFSGSTREVSITGELYFEVTKNPSKPFIVKTYNEEISVRGTSFNVNSYPDEEYIKTSLLEGSVFIGTSVLKPGEAYRNGKVFKADVAMDVAWKNGSFSFRNADLKTIMRQLARWYDLDIIYENKMPSGTFSGEIGRSLTLNQLLKGLTTTKIKYRLESGNRLVIISD